MRDRPALPVTDGGSRRLEGAGLAESPATSRWRCGSRLSRRGLRRGKGIRYRGRSDSRASRMPTAPAFEAWQRSPNIAVVRGGTRLRLPRCRTTAHPPWSANSWRPMVIDRTVRACGRAQADGHARSTRTLIRGALGSPALCSGRYGPAKEMRSIGSPRRSICRRRRESARSSRRSARYERRQERARGQGDEAPGDSTR